MERQLVGLKALDLVGVLVALMDVVSAGAMVYELVALLVAGWDQE